MRQHSRLSRPTKVIEAITPSSSSLLEAMISRRPMPLSHSSWTLMPRNLSVTVLVCLEIVPSTSQSSSSSRLVTKSPKIVLLAVTLSKSPSKHVKNNLKRFLYRLSMLTMASTTSGIRSIKSVRLILRWPTRTTSKSGRTYVDHHTPQASMPLHQLM